MTGGASGLLGGGWWVGLVGLLVGVGVWATMRPGGRSAASVVRGRSLTRGGRRPGVRGSVGLGWRRWRSRSRGSGAAGGSGPPRARGAGEDPQLVLVVVAQVAALLRAGASPSQAWERATGVRVGRTGVPDAERLAEHVGGIGTARAVAAACRLAGEVGAPLVGVLEQIARSIAAEAEARAERDAALSGPRATTRVLLWLPLAGVLLGMVLGADPVATALGGGIGTAGLLLGLLLLLAGRYWSARLVARAREAGEPP